MKFWDSSAIVALLVPDPRTRAMRDVLVQDSAMAAWWVTRVECVSALARLRRENRLDDAGWASATARLAEAARGWTEVPAVDRVREQAARLLRIHPLRAAGALQLAAALVFCEFSPATLDFVALDERLRDAAAQEGFPVVR